MSVLHPVGPEPEQTYWVRRAVVIGAAILALILLIAVIVSQNSSGSVVAEPTTTAPAPSAPSSGPPPYTATPTPAATPTPTPAETPTASASAEPTESAQAKAKAKESAKPTQTAKATESATPKESTKAKESTKPKESAKPKTTPKASGPVACVASDLKPTIDSDNQLNRKEPVTFAISLVNQSTATCTLNITKDNFELKIYSGKDRIWSSNDCSTAVKPVTRKLAKGQAVAWKMTWNGLRSKDDCKNRPEIPRAGTYFATAQYEGAKPVQRRMIIHN